MCSSNLDNKHKLNIVNVCVCVCDICQTDNIQHYRSLSPFFKNFFSFFIIFLYIIESLLTRERKQRTLSIHTLFFLPFFPPLHASDTVSICCSTMGSKGATWFASLRAEVTASGRRPEARRPWV